MTFRDLDSVSGEKGATKKKDTRASFRVIHPAQALHAPENKSTTQLMYIDKLKAYLPQCHRKAGCKTQHLG